MAEGGVVEASAGIDSLNSLCSSRLLGAKAVHLDVEGSFNSSRRNSGSFNSGEEVEMGRVASRESLVE